MSCASREELLSDIEDLGVQVDELLSPLARGCGLGYDSLLTVLRVQQTQIQLLRLVLKNDRADYRDDLDGS